MPSMADAFLAAGVPAVIASPYDVDNAEAPATMRRLHTYLRGGDDAADALRKTTIDELCRGRGRAALAAVHGDRRSRPSGLFFGGFL